MSTQSTTRALSKASLRRHASHASCASTTLSVPQTHRFHTASPSMNLSDALQGHNCMYRRNSSSHANECNSSIFSTNTSNASNTSNLTNTASVACDANEANSPDTPTTTTTSRLPYELASNLRAYHYSQYNLIQRKKQLQTMRLGGYYNNMNFQPKTPSMSPNSPKNCASQQKYNKNQKMLPIAKQPGFLPVRQFDSIAIDLSDAGLQSRVYGTFGFESIVGKNINGSSGSVSHGNGGTGCRGDRGVIALLPATGRKEYFKLWWMRMKMKLWEAWTKMRSVWNVWGGINACFVLYPLVAGSVFAMIKSVVADLFAQTAIDRKGWDDINWRRNAVFAFVGLFWTGFVHYGIYTKLYPKLFHFARNWHWFPKSSAQSIFDNTFHSALFYYPMFYAVKSIAYNGFDVQKCKHSVEQYWYQNFWKDYFTLVCFWFPSHMITFGVVPPHLRVPWVATVSFAWTVLLSVMRGEKIAKIEKNEVVQTIESTESIETIEATQTISEKLEQIGKESKSKVFVIQNSKDELKATGLNEMNNQKSNVLAAIFEPDQSQKMQQLAV